MLNSLSLFVGHICLITMGLFLISRIIFEVCDLVEERSGVRVRRRIFPPITLKKRAYEIEYDVFRFIDCSLESCIEFLRNMLFALYWPVALSCKLVGVLIYGNSKEAE